MECNALWKLLMGCYDFPERLGRVVRIVQGAVGVFENIIVILNYSRGLEK